jgi:hypothetical protein
MTGDIFDDAINRDDENLDEGSDRSEWEKRLREVILRFDVIDLVESPDDDFPPSFEAFDPII